MADEAWVALAVLGRAWGRRGEIAAVSLTSGPERFQGLGQVYLFGGEDAADNPSPMEIESVWEHRGQLVFKFRGIDSISEAERFRGAEVRIPKEQRARLEEGEYYQSDLVGCSVVDRRTGERLGRVSDFRDYGGPPVLEVEPEGGGEPLLVPFARAICVEIDVAGRHIAVELPDGLKEINAR